MTEAMPDSRICSQQVLFAAQRSEIGPFASAVLRGGVDPISMGECVVYALPPLVLKVACDEKSAAALSRESEALSMIDRPHSYHATHSGAIVAMPYIGSPILPEYASSHGDALVSTILAYHDMDIED